MLYHFYIAQYGEDRLTANYTPIQQLDREHFLREGYARLWKLDKAIPIWLAETLQNSLCRRIEREKYPFGAKMRRMHRNLKVIPGDLRCFFGDAPALFQRWDRDSEEFCRGKEESGQSDLFIDFSLLQGRILTEGEVFKYGRAAGKMPGQILASLQKAILLGQVLRRAAVGMNGKDEWVCRRCGEMRNFHVGYCPLCRESDCILCLSCKEMGESRRCQGIYTFKIWRKPFEKKTEDLPHCPVMPALTERQRQISDAVLSWYKKGAAKELILWAVCGAGKTEMIYPLVAEAINQGLYILIAVPRKEVLYELDARFEDVFPGVERKLLSGERRRDIDGAGLHLATTHQALRFYKFFDLIILDEEDAFPYHGNDMLHRAIMRALKDEGRILYLTATPCKRVWKRMEAGRLETLVLPERHHGLALPEPELIRLGMSFSKGKDWIEKNLHFYLDGSLRGSRNVVVFYPAIRKMKEDLPSWEQWCGKYGLRWTYIFAGDPDRSQKIEKLKEGYYQICLSTTILERGVNIPGIDVLVLYADRDKVFRREVLVQIAGRVGRRKDDQGRVYFAGELINHEMKEALAMIKFCNKLAGDVKC